MHEDLDITKHSHKPVKFQLEIALRCDFADIFEVKFPPRSRALWEATSTNRDRPLGLDCKITWLASRPIGKRPTEQLKFEV